MPKGNKAKIRLARNELIVAGILLVLSLVGLYLSNISHTSVVDVGGNSFSVQVADDASERRLGLSGQDALENDEGMLFIFNEPDRYGFWMKDMNFSIDIIWIDENLRVVQIEEEVSPSTYPERFIPNIEALYVLEIYTGQSEAQGIKLGDQVKLNL